MQINVLHIVVYVLHLGVGVSIHVPCRHLATPPEKFWVPNICYTTVSQETSTCMCMYMYHSAGLRIKHSWGSILPDPIGTVEDKKTFPFDVLQNGTVCIVVRCVLRKGIKTLQKRYALKTVVERLKNGYGTVVLLLWNNLLARCVRGCGYMHSWSGQRDRDVSIR